MPPCKRPRRPRPALKSPAESFCKWPKPELRALSSPPALGQPASGSRFPGNTSQDCWRESEGSTQGVLSDMEYRKKRFGKNYLDALKLALSRQQSCDVFPGNRDPLAGWPNA